MATAKAAPGFSGCATWNMGKGAGRQRRKKKSRGKIGPPYRNKLTCYHPDRDGKLQGASRRGAHGVWGKQIMLSVWQDWEGSGQYGDTGGGSGGCPIDRHYSLWERVSRSTFLEGKCCWFRWYRVVRSRMPFYWLLRGGILQGPICFKTLGTLKSGTSVVLMFSWTSTFIIPSAPPRELIPYRVSAGCDKVTRNALGCQELMLVDSSQRHWSRCSASYRVLISYMIVISITMYAVSLSSPDNHLLSVQTTPLIPVVCGRLRSIGCK